MYLSYSDMPCLTQDVQDQKQAHICRMIISSPFVKLRDVERKTSLLPCSIQHKYLMQYDEKSVKIMGFKDKLAE